MEKPIFLRYFISTFVVLKHIQNITTVKQIFQIRLHDIYFLALVFKSTRLYTWCFIWDVSFISDRIPHAALNFFHYFCILLVQSKHNRIKTTLCIAILSSFCTILTIICEKPYQCRNPFICYLCNSSFWWNK